VLGEESFDLALVQGSDKSLDLHMESGLRFF
jgi:hypothetical protein